MPVVRRYFCKLACALTLVACTDDPRDELEALRRDVEAGRLEAIDALVHAEYSDPMGDRAQLMSDLKQLSREYPRIELRWSELSVVRDAQPGAVDVVGRQDVRLVGDVGWKLTGPLRVEFRPSGRLRVRSGLLDDLRAIRQLMDRRRRALEGNDPEGYGALLHPQYRDGDLDRDDAVKRLQEDLQSVAIRHTPHHYRVDVRGPLAHVDERYAIRAGGRVHPRGVARFTLQRSAGAWRIASGLYPKEKKLTSEGSW